MFHRIKKRLLFRLRMEHKTDTILELLQDIKVQGGFIMQAFEDLKAAVAAEVEVDKSVLALIDLFVQKLKDLGDAPTPGQLQELTATLTAEKDKLAAAVTANTPAA